LITGPAPSDAALYYQSPYYWLRGVADTALQLDYELSPARMLSSMLDKGLFRRYSERQIWYTTDGDMPYSEHIDRGFR